MYNIFYFYLVLNLGVKDALSAGEMPLSWLDVSAAGAEIGQDSR